MLRCERLAQANEVRVKERLTAGQVQQPDFPGGIKEIQVLFGRNSTNQGIFGRSTGETVPAIVVAEQVERPVSFDVEPHTVYHLYLSSESVQRAAGGIDSRFQTRRLIQASSFTSLVGRARWYQMPGS